MRPKNPHEMLRMIDLSEVTRIYADGGMIGANPSKKGGTWAFSMNDDRDDQIHHESGLLLPVDIGQDFVTNNITELWAVMVALERLPDRWTGTVFSDSNCTLGRIRRFKNTKYTGVPLFMRERFVAVCRRMGKIGSKVSRWNVFCDDLCNQQEQRFSSRRFLKDVQEQREIAEESMSYDLQQADSHLAAIVRSCC